MTKTLTVIVAAYNVESYLRDSLSSYVGNMPDERLEVLIVDDGSIDGTAEIARSFCERFPGLFRLVQQENGGHGAAINTGIREASGAYVRIIDGDDRICTSSIEALLDALDESEDDLVIDRKREIEIGSGESRILVLPNDIPLRTTLQFSDICTRDDIEEFFMIHSTNVRTSFLRAHGIQLLEHTFYVDYEFIVKISSFAQTIRFLDIESCHYYVGNAQQSVAPANYVRRWDDHTRVTNELLDFSESVHLDPSRQLFVDKRVRLLVNTHYNIALIFDDDRSRGLERARSFREFLRKEHHPFFVSGEKRYKQALLLHKLGFDASKLDKLMGRR